MYTYEIIYTVVFAILASILFTWLDSKRYRREIQDINRQIQQQKADKFINRV